MGYGYEQRYDRRGRRYLVLACDKCGDAGGVRKRTCTARVLTDSLRSVRAWLPYCSPPALCKPCHQKLKATLHESCARGAAMAQADYDTTERLLDSGESLVVAAWGDWHATVPAGFVGVCFRGMSGESYRLVTVEEYDARRHGGRVAEKLSAFVNALPWRDPDGPKEGA